MIRIPSDPALEAKLRQTLSDNLRERRKQHRHLQNLLENAQRESPSLSRQERLALGLLHYQFVKAPVPGLATAVYFGRFILRNWNRLRGVS